MNLLQKTIQDAHKTVAQAFENYSDMDLKQKDVYSDWLCQTYYYVHHVTRILAFAASKCDLYQDHELHFRLIASLNEEKDHDTMILNDLKNMDVQLEHFPEKIETRNFYQSLFYMVETYGPYAIVGYFIPQEGLACLNLGPIYKELKNVYGDKCCSFLKEHCILDITHFGDALKYLERLPESKLPIISMGAFRSAELYAALMKAISTNVNDVKRTDYWENIPRENAS